jgi:hypothetical protein
MKKIDFNQSKELMQVIAILLQLGVIDLFTFAESSVDVADITILNADDYLTLVLRLYGTADGS